MISDHALHIYHLAHRIDHPAGPDNDGHNDLIGHGILRIMSIWLIMLTLLTTIVELFMLFMPGR